MMSSKYKIGNFQILPQVNQFSLNKSHYRQQSDSWTPKSNRVRNRYSFHSKFNQKQPQSPLINTRGLEYLKKYKKNSTPGTYEYQSINYQSGKSSQLRTHNSQRLSSYKNEEKSYPETHEVYNSIESNLTECDKILIKLKNISLKNKDYPYVKKNSMHEYYQAKQTVDVREKEQQEGYWNSNSPETNYSSRYNYYQNTESNAEQMLTRSDNILSYSKTNSSHQIGKLTSSSIFEKKQKEKQRERQRQKQQQQQQPIGSQKLQSVIELRRQRIQQIISNRRNSIDNPIQGNFVRMKARGQKLFSKMVRTRQKSMDNVYIQEQQY